MPDTLLSIPCAAPMARPTSWHAWLRRTWEQLLMDDEDRFLQGACDLADLERRLRRLERGRPDRFGTFPPGP